MFALFIFRQKDYTMQDKLNAIINYIRTQYNRTNLCSGVDCVDENVHRLGHWLAKKGVSANAVSIGGFVVGMLALNFLALEMYGWALICILLNRLGDALDGVVAKIEGKTPFGVFLDAALDYTFYAAVIFGFALADTAQNAAAAAFLLFGFAASACAMLAYGVVAYSRNGGIETVLNESPFYLGGWAQGAETLIVLVVLCVVPGWFVPAAIVLGCWCLIKTLVIISTAYYRFVVLNKGSK